MKVKALRYKDTKEFIHIESYGEEPMVCTSSIPNIQPETATLELMGKVMEADDFFEGLELDMDNVELVEFDLIDVGEVGADIRNKLTPYNNLVALVGLYFKETDVDKQIVLKKLILKETKQSEESIKYIANLL